MYLDMISTLRLSPLHLYELLTNAVGLDCWQLLCCCEVGQIGVDCYAPSYEPTWPWRPQAGSHTPGPGALRLYTVRNGVNWVNDQCIGVFGLDRHDEVESLRVWGWCVMAMVMLLTSLSW